MLLNVMQEFLSSEFLNERYARHMLPSPQEDVEKSAASHSVRDIMMSDTVW